VTRSGGGRDWVDGTKHNMRSCRVASRPAGERRKIGRFKSSAVGIHHRQLVVAVGSGAAVARQVLEYRKDPARLKSLSWL
jgi:hypothetical protein